MIFTFKQNNAGWINPEKYYTDPNNSQRIFAYGQIYFLKNSTENSKIDKELEKIGIAHMKQIFVLLDHMSHQTDYLFQRNHIN